MSSGSSTARWIRRISLVITGVLVVMLVSWVLEDPTENLSTDWTAFDNAADRLFAGDEIYRPWHAETEPLPYLYPPYVLWLALPLRLFGFYGSYAFSVLLTFTALLAGAILAVRSGSDSSDNRRTAVTVCVTSGAAVTSTLIGQYSGIYALSVGAGTYLFSRDRHGWAGLVLALLVIKPNLAVAVPVALAWSRSWRALSGFVAGSIVFLVSTIPFGLDRWQGFVSNAGDFAGKQRDGVIPFDKMVTIQSSVQQVSGFDSFSPLLWVAWMLATGILGLAVLEVWRSEAFAVSPGRALGVLALFMVAANVRVYFYDAVIVAIGCLLLVSVRGVLSSPAAVRSMWAMIAMIWIGLWGGIWLPLNVLTGPIAGVLLVIVAADARSARLARTVEEGTVVVMPPPEDLRAAA